MFIAWQDSKAQFISCFFLLATSSKMDFLQRGEKSCRLNLNEVAAAGPVALWNGLAGWLVAKGQSLGTSGLNKLFVIKRFRLSHDNKK